jgi:hypothetical protein
MLWAAVAVFGPGLRAQDWTTPAGSMRAILRAVAEKRCDVLWDGLPPSYQRDVEALVRGFAQRMDRDIWAGAVAVGRAVADVLAAQKERILAHEKAARFACKPDAPRSFDLIVTAIRRLLDSDVADLDRLAAADVRGLLRSAGGDVLQWITLAAGPDAREKLASLLEVEVMLIAVAEDTATVELSAGGEQERVAMARVDGRWVPADLADAWPRRVARLQRQVEALEFDAATSARVSAALAAATASLRQLAHARSQEDFDLALQQAMLDLQGALRPAKRSKAPPTRPAPAPGSR